jgi:hypothetical protein
MSAVMAQWLRRHDFTDIVERTAGTFNTRGELWEFAGYPGASAMVSDKNHLSRTRELICEMVGPQVADRYRYEPTPSNGMSWRSWLLEPLKWLAIYMPWRIRVPVVQLLWRWRVNTS